MKFSLVEEKVDLSIVIITRNESLGIKRCLDSVIAELSGLRNSEIILVDSSSTDNTVDIAKNFPCEIYNVSGNSLSASLGRYIGTLKSNGKLILYLDGDMELCSGWLEYAIKIVEYDDKAAGIIGIRSDIIYN